MQSYLGLFAGNIVREHEEVCEANAFTGGWGTICPAAESGGRSLEPNLFTKIQL